LAEEIDRLEEAYATELQEEVAATKAELVEKVDSIPRLRSRTVDGRQCSCSSKLVSVLKLLKTL
jgi:hypothetical protein